MEWRRIRCVLFIFFIFFFLSRRLAEEREKCDPFDRFPLNFAGLSFRSCVIGIVFLPFFFALFSFLRYILP